MVSPCDAKNSSEAAQVKGVEPLLLAGVEGPCSAAVEQCAEYTGSTHVHLGVGGQHGVVPHPLCQTSHCC